MKPDERQTVQNLLYELGVVGPDRTTPKFC